MTSTKDIVINAKEYVQAGTLLSQTLHINAQETITLKESSTIGAKQLSLVSKEKEISVIGEVFAQETTSLTTSDSTTITGELKSGVIMVKAKDLAVSGSVIATAGMSLTIENEWKNEGIFKAFGLGLQGVVKKFNNKGDIETRGISLQIEAGSNHGSIHTRGHYALKGKNFTNHRGSSNFTTGVHQIALSGDYADSGNLYTPTLLLAQARHLQFLNGHRSVLKDALLSSTVQITVDHGATFDLYGPRVFLQLSSDGSATFRGNALHNSNAQFPLEKYTGEQPALLSSEIEKIAISHPFRNLKKGSGITVTVRGDVKHAGTMKLDGGALAMAAGGTIQGQRGTMQAGYFSGDSVDMRASLLFSIKQQSKVILIKYL